MSKENKTLGEKLGIEDYKLTSFEAAVSKSDPVSPDHYRVGEVEVIDLVRHMGYLEGNIIKYVTRYRQKNGVEDLYKARKYLNWLIEDEGNA